MAVNPENVDLTHIADVSDIKPAPTLALKDSNFHVGPLGDEGKLLMSQLLDATSKEEPGDARVFNRLGVDYTDATWNGWDVFWAKNNHEVVDALREWNAARG